ITGMSVALECTAVPTIVISLAILGSYLLGRATGIPGAGLFGTAVATMGMLATAAYILAMDTFGPITDNAGGIVEMSHQPEEVRRQFKEKPGILAGTVRPDYGRCVDIVTRGALRQMVLPGILAVAMPIVTGVVFKAAFHAGAEAVAALLMVGTMAGILMATML